MFLQLSANFNNLAKRHGAAVYNRSRGTDSDLSCEVVVYLIRLLVLTFILHLGVNFVDFENILLCKIICLYEANSQSSLFSLK